MKMLSRIARRLGLTMVSLALVLGPATAQQDEAPVTFPTVLALQQASIPPRDRVQLAQALLGAGDMPPRPVTAPEYTPGQHRRFNVVNASDDRAFTVDATLMAIGEHIYFWVETGAPVDPNRLRSLAASFDTYIYPETRALWGSEDNPGIDGDPRIHGLFAYDLGTGTAAYFVSEHVYPREAVSTSNEHEMFFFNLDAIGPNFNQRAIESIVAHEFQHMIRNHLQVNTEYWLNEGFSEFTQLHLYDVPVWEIVSFLSLPDTQLNTWSESGMNRAQHYGAALLFTTYFADRFGLDALGELSAERTVRGLDAVNNVLARRGEPDVDSVFADWVVANHLFDPALKDGRFGYQSIGSGIVTAQPIASITGYPYTYEDTVAQYGTDYLALTNLGEAAALEISFEAPETVPLVPADPYSGRHVWYSNKADMSSTTLTRAFDLSGVESATLSFALWFHIERAWDYGYVMASVDGGATWDILSTERSTTDNPHNTAYGPGYTGLSGGWHVESASLDAYAGSEVLIRFQMITDDAVTQPGMVIDDVQISEIGYFEDFELDGGRWEAEGWLWIDNVLPQDAWVQAIQHVDDTASVTRWQASGAEHWTLLLEPGVDQVVLAVSAFAPVTTVAMPYTLEISLTQE